MFVAVWDVDNGPESLCIDARDDEHARAIARDVGGSEPSRIVVMPPGTFAACVAFGDDEDEHGNVVVTLDPLPHVASLLAVIEASEGEGESSPSSSAPVCGELADYEGEMIACDLARGHDGEHQGMTSGRELVDW